MHYRLDPTVAGNLKSWHNLRITYIEDKKQASALAVSIKLMNRAICVCFLVVVWLCYEYFYLGALSENGPNTTTYLFLTYIFNILVPVIYTLNSAVKTVCLVEGDCISKLSLLELNV
jgi:hypothetical protein